MKKEVVAFVVLIVISLLLIGCAGVDSKATDKKDVNGSKDKTADTKKVDDKSKKPESKSASACESNWKCISGTIKAYQLENCSFTSKRETCKFGCVEGDCKPAPVCTSGFGCKNDNVKGFQTEGCDWINTVKCENGCENAKCLEKNETKTTTTTETTSSTTTTTTTPSVVYETLDMGSKLELTLDSKNYTIMIYNMDEEQVKLRINGKNTGWLKQNESAKLGSKQIWVKELYYQGYGGGTKQVSYVVE